VDGSGGCGVGGSAGCGGAGGASGNVHRDPEHSGILRHFIERNTPHLFGGGAVQRLAEEMTVTLQGIRTSVVNAACSGPSDTVRTANLTAKGVNFGVITVRQVRRGGSSCPNSPFHRFAVDLSGVRGVDTDLIVKPFQWKGSVAFIRDFNRDAAHNELGMQAVELAGDGVDGDFDGAVDELSIGDQTAPHQYFTQPHDEYLCRVPASAQSRGWHR